MIKQNTAENNHRGMDQTSIGDGVWAFNLVGSGSGFSSPVRSSCSRAGGTVYIWGGGSVTPSAGMTVGQSTYGRGLHRGTGDGRRGGGISHLSCNPFRSTQAVSLGSMSAPSPAPVLPVELSCRREVISALPRPSRQAHNCPALCPPTGVSGDETGADNGY